MLSDEVNTVMSIKTNVVIFSLLEHLIPMLSSVKTLILYPVYKICHFRHQFT